MDKSKNDRIDSEKLAHLLRSNLVPPAFVYPKEMRPLRALLRQRAFFVWSRTDHLARLQSHQLAHNRPTLPGRNCYNRDPWEEALLAREDNPASQFAIKHKLAIVRHFDTQITALETQLQRFTRKIASRDYTLLQSIPGIGKNLRATVLYEIGDIDRFPTVKDFLSYCRLVKRHRGQCRQDQGPARCQTRQPYLRWAFGEAAVIAKHSRLQPQCCAV